MEGLKEKVKEWKALWRKRDKFERECIEQFIPAMVGRFYCIKAKECGDVAYFKVLSAELDKKTSWIDIAVDGVNFDFIEETYTFNGVRHIDEEDTHGLDGLLDFNEITEEEFRTKYAVWTKVVEMKKELGISIEN
ncbi:MAG: hypothetical protein IJK62_09820 [Bacteroidales bacterium]|nr:hypothetical protein [Bacteroidales bacterium]MBQ6276989.1 hypothetical protein [Bacteroidales bacterium]